MVGGTRFGGRGEWSGSNNSVGGSTKGIGEDRRSVVTLTDSTVRTRVTDQYQKTENASFKSQERYPILRSVLDKGV